MKEKAVVGFVFEEVPLQEALNVTLAGKGHYAQLGEHLLKVLPTLQEKAYAFGLPSGKEVTDEARKNICMTLAQVFRRASLTWKIMYSENRKLFICVPSAPLVASRPSLMKSRDPAAREKILNLHNQGLTPQEIGKMTGFSKNQIRYTLYRTNGPKKDSRKPAEPFIALAKRVFGVSEFSRSQRKAVCMVGVKDLGILPKNLGSLTGLTSGGVAFNANAKTTFGADEINKLRNAVKKGDQ